MSKTILVIPTEIEILTGLHIGWSDQEFEIWGIDNPVVMKPYFDNESNWEIQMEPYIPGSSIKWRMRALIEKYEYGVWGKSDNLDGYSFVVNKIWIIQDQDHEVSKLFWASWKDENDKPFHISWNIIVKDFVLQQDYFEKYKNWELILEEKMENTVPRFVDKNTNPRRIQRVPAGTKFVGVFIIVGDDDKDMENKFELFKKWIDLIQSTYIGGSWTRGYGTVRFRFYASKWKKIEEILKEAYEDREIKLKTENNKNNRQNHKTEEETDNRIVSLAGLKLEDFKIEFNITNNNSNGSSK